MDEKIPSSAVQKKEIKMKLSALARLREDKMKKNMKKTALVALAVLLAMMVGLLLTGCGDGSDTTTPFETLPPYDGTTTGTDSTEETTDTTPVDTTSTEPVNPPITEKYRNPLTGVPTNKDYSGKRPLAIVVDNCDNALDRQTGLTKADILYEALVAPGITRFLAVYSDYSEVDSVCNIRSGRDYHMDMAAFHNAALMCHGGSNTKNYDFFLLAKNRYGSRYGFIDTMEEPWFCQAENGEIYGTIAHAGARRDLQYDTLFRPRALDALLASATYSKFVMAGGSMNQAPRQSFEFDVYKKMPADAERAVAVDFSFTSQGTLAEKKINFRYKASTGKYLRYQDTIAHEDAETGEQLAFTNVLTLFTTVDTASTALEEGDRYMTLVKVTGEGTGYYFYGGKVMEISWKTSGNRLDLFDADGAPLTLAAGNTYVGYLDSDFAYGGDSFWE